MSEKVKVTQEQSDWLDRYELTQEQVDHYIDVQPLKKRPDSPIVDWTASKVARALYVGYEVEPEYKVGDWVVLKYKDVRVIGKIVEIEKEEFTMAKVDDPKYPVPQLIAVSKLRYATEQEIAQEKERRFWSKHGRDIKEYRIGDVVHDSNGGIGMVTGFKESVGYAGLLVNVSGVGFCTRGELKLISPVDRRLDISHE